MGIVLNNGGSFCGKSHHLVVLGMGYRMGPPFEFAFSCLKKVA